MSRFDLIDEFLAEVRAGLEGAAVRRYRATAGGTPSCTAELAFRDWLEARGRTMSQPELRRTAEQLERAEATCLIGHRTDEVPVPPVDPEAEFDYP